METLGINNDFGHIAQRQFEKEDAFLRAKKRLKELKAFYYSLVLYFLVIPFLIFINYKTYWDFKWFWFPMFGWGLGLIIGVLKVFVSDKFFGNSWEKRKIKQFMRDEDRKHEIKKKNYGNI